MKSSLQADFERMKVCLEAKKVSLIVRSNGGQLAITQLRTPTVEVVEESDADELSLRLNLIGIIAEDVRVNITAAKWEVSWSEGNGNGSASFRIDISPRDKYDRRHVTRENGRFQLRLSAPLL